MKLLARLRILFGLAAAPVELPRVHRGEREISAGADAGRIDSIPPKLSAADALRCFGVVQAAR